jgi:transposase-like protein
MPKPFPKEFREDVIRVYRESDASMAEAAGTRAELAGLD